MNTKPLTLQEVSKIVEESSIEESMSDPRISEFIERVETTGKDILKAKENCGEYVEDASHLLLAATLYELANGRDKEDLMAAITVAKNPRLFTLVIGYAFIYAVGICATEGLR